MLFTESCIITLLPSFIINSFHSRRPVSDFSRGSSLHMTHRSRPVYGQMFRGIPRQSSQIDEHVRAVPVHGGQLDISLEVSSVQPGQREPVSETVHRVRSALETASAGNENITFLSNAASRREVV